MGDIVQAGTGCRHALALFTLLAMPTSGLTFEIHPHSGSGLTGVLDTPLAFGQPEGETSLIYFHSDHVNGLAVGFQPYPWLETALSFPNYDDIGGGVSSSSQSINLKFRLLEETATRPEVALGFTGLLANDRDSAELLAASKHFGDFYGTIGIGWGRLGGSADLGSPFGSRPALDPGRIAGIDHLFKGDAGLFLNAAWQTPVKGLSLLGSYGSDTFANEAYEPSSRFSYGLEYRMEGGAKLTLAHMNGDTIAAQLTFHGNPLRPPVQPNIGPGPLPIEPRARAPQLPPGWAGDAGLRQNLANAIVNSLGEQQIRALDIKLGEREITATVSGNTQFDHANLIGRTARTLAAHAPASVETFRIRLRQGPYTTNEVVLPRRSLEESVDTPSQGQVIWDATEFTGAAPESRDPDYTSGYEGGLSWSLYPAVNLRLDPDNSIRPSVNAVATARYSFSPKTYVSATLKYPIYREQVSDPPPAVIPARSDWYAYNHDELHLDRLVFVHRRKLGNETYSRTSIGYLERQYAGVSSELLWKPADSPFGLGIELNHVVKRDYDDAFSTLDYDSTTGHGSVYWESPFTGVSLQLDAGRYLAGDWGAGLTLGRRFANGWNVAVSTTWTEAMGDDDLDVGFEVEVPFSWAAPLRTRERTTIGLGTSGGDYGARVNVPDRIYEDIRDGGYSQISNGWGQFWN